jgi:hypothetical protein
MPLFRRRRAPPLEPIGSLLKAGVFALNGASVGVIGRQHAAAESDYHRAIHVLSVAIRSLKKPNGYVLEDFADSARKIVEGAWEALERHTTEHGC